MSLIERINRGPLDILDRSIPARTLIFSLVIPSFVEEFMMILSSYVDTAMVGSIGVHATAAVAINGPALGLTNGFNFGLSIGFSVMISRFIGEARIEKAEEVIKNAMFHILWFGSLLTLIYTFVLVPNYVRWMGADEAIWKDAMAYMRYLGYSRIFLVTMMICSNLMRGQGDTRRPMICNVLRNVINVFLNLVFIYPTRVVSILGFSFTAWGAGMGVAGAAIATSLSNVLSGLLSLYFVFRPTNKVHIKLSECVGVRPTLLRHIYRLGIPIAGERLVINGGQLATMRMLTGISSAVVAANSLANTAESICYMPVSGFSIAATTLVAQWLGAGDSKRATELGNACIKYACRVMVVTATLLYIFAPNIIDIFTDDARVIAMAAEALRVQAFAEIFVAIAMTTAGILRGAGDTHYSSMLTMSSMWLVRVPLAYILINFFDFHLLGVWIPMALDWTTRGILMTIRYRRGKWKTAWKKS